MDLNTINKQHSEDTVRIPLFSIGIVCYRNWEYLNDAIDSVLSQDYPRIQLIISDDGSDGFPIDSFRDYIESHRRDNLVEYLVRQSEQNEGTVRHLNHVFDEMHGQYVMFMAGDDMLDHAEVFSQYAGAFQTEGEDCECIIAQTAMYDNSMTNLMGYYTFPNVIDAINRSDQSDDLLQELFYLPCLPTTTMVFRHSLMDRLGPFDTTYKLIEDYPFHLKLAKEHVKMRFHHFVGARHREGGISHGAINALSESKRMYMQDCIRCRKEILRMSKDADIPRRVRSFSKWQIREMDYQLTTVGKGWKGQLSWLIKEPFDFLRRKLEIVPPVENRRLAILIFFFLALVLIPEQWYLEVCSAIMLSLPRLLVSIMRFGAIIVTGLVTTVLVLSNYFKNTDEIPKV